MEGAINEGNIKEGNVQSMECGRSINFCQLGIYFQGLAGEPEQAAALERR